MKTSNLLWFAIGAGLGCGITYLAMRNHIDQLVQEAIEIEEDKVTVPERICITPGEPSSKRSDKKHEQKAQMKKIIRQYDGKGNATSVEVDDDYPSEDDDEEEDPAAWRQYADDIYVITEAEFSEGMPGQESISIFYYDLDDEKVLVDVDEQPFEDPTTIVGFEALDSFGPDDVVYVRNERFGIDYEVIRLAKSYTEALGMFPPGVDQDDEE